MSHHYSGPNIGFPRGDARLDLTDLYAFPKPGDSAKSIFIMNVHPSVGLKPPGPTTDEPFATEARYELLIDTDGDVIADICYEVRFRPSEGGGQTATLRRIEGAQALETRAGGNVLADDVVVSMGREVQVTQTGDHRFFVGWRSDPFFFDVLGTIDNFQFTAGDFFTDKDICSIALDIPNAPGLDRLVRLPQTWRFRQVGLHHEPSSIGRAQSAGAYDGRAVRDRGPV
jgi:hypothetical protein